MATLSRRGFLQVGAAAFAAPTVITSPIRGDKAPSRRITLGFIGVGTMGRGHLHSFLNFPDVQVLAVCDVVEERRASAKKIVEDRYAKSKGAPKACTAYTDFRDLLARKDVDAVVIATPDHWHAIPCVLAARAKKDIYCEKPLTLAIAQGRKIVEEVAKNKVIFQTGSQQRTEFGQRFRNAAELVRNGRLGTVKTIRIGVGGPAVPCRLPGQPVPKGTDWKFWLGPAPWREYHSDLCPRGVHGHFPAWRNYIEYAGGGLADMGAHHFDIAQWALNMDHSGPVKIEPPASPANTGLKFTYASGVVMYHGGPADCVFEGTSGTLSVSRGSISSNPAAILKVPLGARDVRLGTSTNHRRDWLDAVKARKQPICPAEIGHRTATICHLANIGYQLRRALRWDAVAEKFIDDAGANKLVDRELSAPWKL